MKSKFLKPFEGKISHEAHDFQKIQIDSIKDLEYAAIFDEQGLGKTKIAIDILVHWLKKDYVDTVIIFTKKILVYNWKKEMNVHTDIIPSLILSQDSKSRKEFNRPKRIYISNFESLTSFNEKFKRLSEKRNLGVILDESAKIKNPDSKLTKTFLDFSLLTKRRLILTGTPIANRPQDIYSQIYFLDNGYHLGDNFKEFKSMVDIPKVDLQDQVLESYADRLTSVFPKITNFCFRETKASIGLERLNLPDIHYKNIECDWEANQLSMYQDIKNDVELNIIKNGMRNFDLSEELIKKLLRLIQAASNPFLIDESYKKENGKLKYLMSIVHNILEKNEKVIIWSSFVNNVISLSRYFKSKDIDTSVLYGKLSTEQKERNIDRFLTNTNCNILIANPAAAKEGLTLTCANHAVYYDRNFVLDDYLQSQARIHRLSQTKTCFIYHLLMRDSIDFWVNDYLKAKETIAQYTQGDIDIEEFNTNIPTELKTGLSQLIDDD